MNVIISKVAGFISCPDAPGPHLCVVYQKPNGYTFYGVTYPDRGHRSAAGKYLVRIKPKRKRIAPTFERSAFNLAATR